MITIAGFEIIRAWFIREQIIGNLSGIRRGSYMEKNC